MTTEPIRAQRAKAPGTRRRRGSIPSRFAGRPRIVGWIVAVTAISQILMILAVSFSLRTTVSEGIREGIDQEAGELTRFAAQGVDPATAEAFTDVPRFLEVYLARQEPERGELLVGSAGGSEPPTQVRGPAAPALEALDEEARAQVMTPGTTGSVNSPAVGVITWRNVEVRLSASTGFVAVVEFHESREAQLRAQLISFALLAAAVLLATGLVAWWVAGRIEKPMQRFEQEAEGLGEGEGELRLPEQGEEEYARLARAANAMLAGAERRVEAEQQFTDDVVHQLRAPLAILHGNLDQPPRTPEARELVAGRGTRRGPAAAEGGDRSRRDHPI